MDMGTVVLGVGGMAIVELVVEFGLPAEAEAAAAAAEDDDEPPAILVRFVQSERTMERSEVCYAAPTAGLAFSAIFPRWASAGPASRPGRPPKIMALAKPQRYRFADAALQVCGAPWHQNRRGLAAMKPKKANLKIYFRAFECRELL